MIQLIKNLITTDLGRALTVLPLIMLANNCLGAVLGDLKGRLDKALLWTGIKKGGVIYAAIALFTIVSMLAPELSVNFANVDVDLVTGMYMIIWAAITAYGYDGLTKLARIFKYKTGDN